MKETALSSTRALGSDGQFVINPWKLIKTSIAFSKEKWKGFTHYIGIDFGMKVRAKRKAMGYQWDD